MKALLLAASLLLLCACGGGGGGGDATALPPATAPVRTTLTIASTHAAMTYDVQVYLPAGYATSTRRYPVIYAADAEWRFNVLSDVLERQNRAIILVNVGNMGGARRFVDFTMPGAEAYYRFLTQELIPRVEAAYRADPADRTYCGHSLSGEFALYAFYLEQPGARFFRSIISEEGSFWYGPDQRIVGSPLTAEPATRMEAELFARDRNLQATLVMAGDGRGNAALVAPLYEHLAGRGYPNLRHAHFTYNLGHLPMDGVAFTEALQFIFGPP